MKCRTSTTIIIFGFVLQFALQIWMEKYRLLHKIPMLAPRYKTVVAQMRSTLRDAPQFSQEAPTMILKNEMNPFDLNKSGWVNE